MNGLKEATLPKHLNDADDFEMVPVGRLKTHPRNVNQADLGAVIESIKEHGFYGSLTVQRGTSFVLAGNHRLLAARQLGFDLLPVTWVDVSDEAALRLMLVDNRTTRLGNDNPAALAELLAELAATDKGLIGTAFALEDLQVLLDDLAGPMFDPASIDEQGRLDEKKKCRCPECGHEFAPE